MWLSHGWQRMCEIIQNFPFGQIQFYLLFTIYKPQASHLQLLLGKQVSIHHVILCTFEVGDLLDSVKE